MSTTTLRPGLSTPFWFWIPAGLGLAWNLFGLMRFLDTAFASPESLVAGGMTPDQALFYAALPLWLNLAFGIGVGSGVLGCGLLLRRRGLAIPVLGVSLGAYLVLYAGDITQGVFAAFGMAQVVILSVVVLIAAGLLWFARAMARRGLLA